MIESESLLKVHHHHTVADDDDDDERLITKRQYYVLHKYRKLSSIGRIQVVGCMLLCTSIILGCVTKRNDDLPLISGYVSNIMGYIFFLAWSLSFYPQTLLNWERKTTLGFSTAFVNLNLCGYVVYSLYNVLFFYNSELQQAYRDTHNGQNILIESHDVLFALHGFVLTFVQLMQCYYYDGWKQCPSYFTGFVCFVVLALPATWYLGVFPLLPLKLVYFMSYEKIFITLVKYAPQVMANAERQSTAGWSIDNILLDMTGGIFSMAQLLLDGRASGDISNVLGNSVKLGLSVITIVYDTIFCLQHYVWYRHRHPEDEKVTIEKLESHPIID